MKNDVMRFLSSKSRIQLFSIFFIVGISFFSQLSASAQQKTISGTVIGEDKVPVPGVSVIVKGTTIGTTTDTDGQFRIRVSADAKTLIFSFIGMKTKEIPLGNQTVLHVEMSAETVEIADVVAVGYSSKRRTQLSSSVSFVTGAQLNDVTSNNITSLLQGKAAGVIISNESGNPAEKSTITIRGSSSISAGAQPLYVVDGIIGGNAIPSDVATVTILKDAAATGLYGSRASNGVVVITTKSGTSGKTRVNFNISSGFNDPTFGKLKMMDSQQAYDFEKTFFSAADFQSKRPSSILNTNTDWLKLGFRRGLTKNYSVSVSGGSEKTQFYGSGNYYKEEGTLNHTGNEVYNLRSNITHSITDKLKLSVKFNAFLRNFENEASGGDGALRNSTNNMPYDDPYNLDGSLKIGTETGWVGPKQDNFLHGWSYNFDKSKQQNVDVDVNLDYNILPNLTFFTYNRASVSNSKRELYYDVRSKAGKGLGSLNNDFYYDRKIITSNRLTYDKKFKKHTLNALAVYEAEKNYHDQNTMYGTGLPPGLHIMDVAANIQKSGTHPGYTSENAFSKGLVQADYSFDNKYFAVGSLIRESSSRFGIDKRAAFFYTLGTSWIVSKEKFMADLKAINQLKLRASYGSVGNAEIGDYQSLGLYSYSAQYNGNSASVPSRVPNPDLTWEKAEILDFGLDFDVFNRISLSLDWYDKTSKGLLLDVPLPYTSGYASLIQNIGSIRNRGFEVALSTMNIKTKDFSWETKFNIGFNKNRVLVLTQGKDITLLNLRISEGRDLYSWYFRKWAGVDPANGDPLWEIVNPDGSITKSNAYNSATLQFTGTASPDFTGGFYNRIAYKAVSLSAFFNFVSGNLVNNNERYHYDADGGYVGMNSMILPDDWTRWANPGDIATHPKPVYGGNKLSNKPSSRYLEDGSYVRLKNVTLDYKLPTSLLQKVKIASAKIYVSGDNLWTGTKFSGMDPEVSFSMASNTIGSYPLKYPISRKVLFGVTIDF